MAAMDDEAREIVRRLRHSYESAEALRKESESIMGLDKEGRKALKVMLQLVDALGIDRMLTVASLALSQKANLADLSILKDQFRRQGVPESEVLQRVIEVQLADSDKLRKVLEVVAAVQAENPERQATAIVLLCAALGFIGWAGPEWQEKAGIEGAPAQPIQWE